MFMNKGPMDGATLNLALSAISGLPVRFYFRKISSGSFLVIAGRALCI